jgi:hypothetical protein
MTLRTTAAVLATLTIGGSSLVMAAGDTLAQDEWRHRHRDAVREIRQAVREAVRDVRHDTRHVVRDVVRDVMHEVHAALGWTWSDDDYASAERRREQDDRRREDAERRRERLESRRNDTSAP